MQNSGLGNIVNPLLSLTAPEVYNIPMVLLIGWRGKPGIKDEPQHITQGRVTPSLLDLLQTPSVIIKSNMTLDKLQFEVERLAPRLNEGRTVAFLVEKNAFVENSKQASNQRSVADVPTTPNTLIRENILSHIVRRFKQDFFVSTTGVTSRELFELRTQSNQSHDHDFLTVGSMGHASSIALGIRFANPHPIRIWCIDGDGAALMHLGALATIGASKVQGFVHVVFNNEAHESVGGLPTVAGVINLSMIAKACGYNHVLRVSTQEEVTEALDFIAQERAAQSLIFLEVKIRQGARSNLGRPTTTPTQNKEVFMNALINTSDNNSGKVNP
jgi:phosphonopyruvate decarboxylase